MKRYYQFFTENLDVENSKTLIGKPRLMRYPQRSKIWKDLLKTLDAAESEAIRVGFELVTPCNKK
ncbi:MAG: hypothetical protein RLZZ479_1075 [Bacteroidota bacterium]|jgi:hypothetical protein